jgi:hypothetical protein
MSLPVAFAVFLAMEFLSILALLHIVRFDGWM